MLFEQRLVKNGREYYDESRHTVTFVRDAAEKRDVVVMSADDVSPAVWRLKICVGPKCDKFLEARVRKTEERDEGAWRDLVFTDYGKAIKLAHWLRFKSPGYSTKEGIEFNYTSEHQDPQTSLVPDKNTKNDCEEHDD